MAIEPGRQFSNLPVELRFTPAEEPNGVGHTVRAYHQGDMIGRMHWDDATGVISHVGVDEPYRNMGVATSMWNEGHRLAEEHGIPAPRHSGSRTALGDSWARSVGGDLPE